MTIDIIADDMFEAVKTLKSLLKDVGFLDENGHLGDTRIQEIEDET